MAREPKREKPAHDAIGKDDMNLLEYCVFSATNRVDRTTKSLTFESEPYCENERRRVKRRLTVAFSAEYGRPTCRDDQIAVALVKLSRDEGFQSQKVPFTRYQILRILQWDEKGRNYQAIDQAFNRIMGMHMVWDNAYWDRGQQSWVDRKFSMIDDAKLYTREKYDRARIDSGEQRPQSWFKWSDVMFESFQSGYIKTLDMDVFRSLEGDVAKRLFRWLDKQFNNPNRRFPIEMPLADLATQKLGFRHAPPSHLVRMLEPAIDELVEKCHLQRDSQRFTCRDKSVLVRFRPARRGVSVSQPVEKTGKEQPNELETRLIERGVVPGREKPTSAGSLVRDFPAEKIKRSIAYFDDANNRAPAGRTKGPGFLIASIRAKNDGGFVPDEFKTKEQLRQQQIAREQKRAAESAADRKRGEAEQRAADEKRHRFLSFFNSFDEQARRKLEAEALQQTDNRLLIEKVRGSSGEGEPCLFRQMLWEEHIMPGNGGEEGKATASRQPPFSQTVTRNLTVS